MDPQIRCFFGQFFRLLVAPASILSNFGYQKYAPAHAFSRFFRKRWFCQNRAPTVAGAQFWRVTSSKNRPGRRPRKQKRQERPKNCQKVDLGSQLLAQKAVLGRFFDPWRNRKTAFLKWKCETKKHRKKHQLGDSLGGWRGPRTRTVFGRISGRQARSSTPSLILRMGRRIEPAEPEPPPAHSIGRVGEDAMGRSGQFVKPCWLGAGDEALVVGNWWRGSRLGLYFRYFLDIFGRLGQGKSTKL